MTVAESDHRAAVKAWMASVRREPPTAALVDAFEKAFGALWERSHVVLGEVTLLAIIDRILFTASDEYPLIASLDVDARGLHCDRLVTRPGLRDDDLAAAFEAVLLELLSVLGNLTAQILTPALHAALADVTTGAASAARGTGGEGAP